MSPARPNTAGPAARTAEGAGGAAGGPYRVERIDTAAGPRWRLAGPGLDVTRSYPWHEFGEKLQELAAVMNFAWAQGRVARREQRPAPADGQA
jgi:hypothetical protein